MVRVAAVLLVVLVVPGPLMAQDGDAPVAEPAQVDTHTVERSETLEDLARQYFGDSAAWERIFEANRDKLEDPDRIREGQRLVIPGEDDVEEVATGEEEDEPAVVRAIHEVEAADDPGAHPPPESPGSAADPVDRTSAHRSRAFEPRSPGNFPEGQARTVFYYQDLDHRPEPELVMADEEPWSEVPAGAWAGAPWLATGGDHGERLGAITDFASGREHQAAGRVAIHPYDRLRVSVREPDHGLAPGDRLLAYRVEPVAARTVVQAGAASSEDDVEEPVQVRPTGVLEVERIEGAGVVARVTREFRPMRVFDGVAPYTETASEPGDHPTVVDPANALTGELVGFEEDRQVVHRGARGYLDVGSDDGVQPGDVFVALGGSDDADDWSAEEVARLQVLRVEETSAVVRVEQLHAPVRDGHLPVRQVLAMP